MPDTETLPAPPGHLSKEARELFATLVEEYEFEPVELATLTLALEAYDQAATARRRVKRDGQIVLDRFDQPKAHPAVTIHRDALATWARLMGQLGIPTDEDARPVRDSRGHFSKRGSRNGRS
jgi:P27 family predicted phage terminase small subunit